MNQNFHNSNFELEEEIKTLDPKLLDSLLDSLLGQLQANLSVDLTNALNGNLENFSLHLDKYQKQLEEINQNVTKLSRLQYKANTLSETQEKNLTTALTSLQEAIKRQDKLQEEYKSLDQQQLAKERSQSRCEFAIEMLPVLDGIESAIDNGYALLKRKNIERETLPKTTNSVAPNPILDPLDPSLIVRVNEAKLASEPQTTITKLKKLTLWERLKVAIKGEILIEQSLLNPTITEPNLVEKPVESFVAGKSEVLISWLKGLELVRERFVGLLANEGIRAIETQGQQIFLL
ncbi:MAG: hypothetical protein FD167_1849, partial [bacterium]